MLKFKQIEVDGNIMLPAGLSPAGPQEEDYLNAPVCNVAPIIMTEF